MRLNEGLSFLVKLDRFAGIRARWIWLRDVQTNPNYGKHPEKRSLEELLNQGVINLDKPPGPTSHEVTSWVKELLGVKKAGHAGTLEPA